MKKYDVVIIGGGPSGLITGITGKKQNPDKSFLLIKKTERDLVPCGIPYIFHDLGEVSKNAMGPKPFIDAGGEVLVDTVANIDFDKKILETENEDKINFDKLVFATGSIPIVPTFIPGYDLDGVEYIKKNYDYIASVKEKTDTATNIVVIGGGFIGVELAEQLSKFEEKKVTLVEMEKYCLYRAFSEDLAERADKVIRNTGINLKTSSKVEEIIGENGKVSAVKLADGSLIEADLVIASIGYRPNSDLAKASGLEINSKGAIRVDQYQKTTREDIFAVGDCSQTVGFITGRTDNIMLASTATSEARNLGYNLYKINVIKDFIGTLSVFSTEIGGKVFASAGAIEQAARENNVEFVTGKFEAVDRHPGTIADTSPLAAKLIVSPKTGTIIGGELCGGKSVGELINVIGLAIQKKVTVHELITFQIGTHPLLTTAPTKYVLIKAAEAAINKL